MINIAEIAKKRHTCKAYDKSKKISKEVIDQLLEVLHNSPSSVNSQPWHFIVAESDEAKEQILPGISEFNHPRVRNASHVVIFCAKNEMNDDHLAAIIEQEDADKRFPEPEMKTANDQGRKFFVGLNRTSKEALYEWEEKQVYIALGNLLLAAAALEVDSTPIEGFIPEKLDEVLGLKEKGYHSVVVASLGYRSEEDFNADLPKSRLPFDNLFTIL